MKDTLLEACLAAAKVTYTELPGPESSDLVSVHLPDLYRLIASVWKVHSDLHEVRDHLARIFPVVRQADALDGIIAKFHEEMSSPDVLKLLKKREKEAESTRSQLNAANAAALFESMFGGGKNEEAH